MTSTEHREAIEEHYGYYRTHTVIRESRRIQYANASRRNVSYYAPLLNIALKFIPTKNSYRKRLARAGQHYLRGMKFREVDFGLRIDGPFYPDAYKGREAGGTGGEEIKIVLVAEKSISE